MGRTAAGNAQNPTQNLLVFLEGPAKTHGLVLRPGYQSPGAFAHPKLLLSAYPRE